MPTPSAPSPYGLFLLGGIGVSIFLWTRMVRRDERLVPVYLAGLCGAFLGAKIIYFLAEGWLHLGAVDMWLQLATGKTVVGALIGGYGGVELGKKLTDYPTVTGDWFAVIAPLGIVFGRIGCLLEGCCLGSVCESAWYSIKDRVNVDRWPAVPVELAFNLVFLILVLCVLRPRNRLTGQHFHVYLIAYGLFRFGHEVVRDTPRMIGPLSGYQLAALALIVLGVARFQQRRQTPGQPRPA